MKLVKKMKERIHNDNVYFERREQQLTNICASHANSVRLLHFKMAHKAEN